MKAKVFFKRLGLFSLLVVSSGAAWYFNRPQPDNLVGRPFQGVVYRRIAVEEPRHVVLHFIEIDLDGASPRFKVTDGHRDRELPYDAHSVSEFLEETGVQLAINGSFFTPWWSNGILDYYPHTGDPLKTKGISVSEGKVICRYDPNYPALYISKEGIPSFEPQQPAYNAIAGKAMFVKNGRFSLEGSKDRFCTQPEPRTAIGLTKDRKKMIIMVVDGRQPRYSEGLSLQELAQYAIDLGVDEALAFDGGGSTALVIQDFDNSPKQLNCPIDKRIPGRERPVANHLGIYLER
jgi:hypothetical protein